MPLRRGPAQWRKHYTPRDHFSSRYGERERLVLQTVSSELHICVQSGVQNSARALALQESNAITAISCPFGSWKSDLGKQSAVDHHGFECAAGAKQWSRGRFAASSSTAAGSLVTAKRLGRDHHVSFAARSFIAVAFPETLPSVPHRGDARGCLHSVCPTVPPSYVVVRSTRDASIPSIRPRLCIPGWACASFHLSFGPTQSRLPKRRSSVYNTVLSSASSFSSTQHTSSINSRFRSHFRPSLFDNTRLRY